MQFTFGDSEFDIRFRYISYNTTDNSKLCDTFCIISRIHPDIPSGRERYVIYHKGRAKQSCQDQFVKETGRKIALTRALYRQNKSFRKLAWKAYFDRKK